MSAVDSQCHFVDFEFQLVMDVFGLWLTELYILSLNEYE